MNLNKVLETMSNFNEYVSASRNDDWEEFRIGTQLNMSTVLAMKRIQMYEIEYFNKYGENGFACIAMIVILKHPPSKIWAVLSKELVDILKYWLEALTKHLIRHNSQWLSFLQVIIKLIKEIRLKHTSVPNILVEKTAECLLDLSTNERSDEYQKIEILQCFNMVCADSSREIRIAMRNKFSDYFVELSAYMSTCGLFLCQFVIMETLLKWLVPRHNQDVRVSSARKWFPKELYSQKAVDIFLGRAWRYFSQDARYFLNTHNEENNIIFSLICDKILIEDLVINSSTKQEDLWLDINATGSCMSILFDPQMLGKIGVQNHNTCEAVIISEENTSTVQLRSESQLIVLSVTTLTTPELFPSSIRVHSEEECTLQIFVSSRSDLMKLDMALRRIFADKYRLMIDLKRKYTQSIQDASQNSFKTNTNQTEVKLSLPAEKQRSRRSGYISVSRFRAGLCNNSPSTTSTTSLALLDTKLAALPICISKPSVRVSESPNLPPVLENDESNEEQTCIPANELKFSRSNLYGTSTNNINEVSLVDLHSYIEDKTTGTVKLADKNVDNSTSSLLKDTIGLTDASLPKNTIQHMPIRQECKSDNIVDLLIKEALDSNIKKKEVVVDVYLNSDAIVKNSKKKNSPGIIDQRIITDSQNTQEIQDKKKNLVRHMSSSTDDSNANIINETPMSYVTYRRKNLHVSAEKKPTNKCNSGELLNKGPFNEAIVDDFFKQHFNENQDGNLVKSPALANKNNKSSPRHDSPRYNINELPNKNIADALSDINVSERLNNSVDKVCCEFNGSTKNCEAEEINMINKNKVTIYSKTPSQKDINEVSSGEYIRQNKPVPKNKLQLKFPVELGKSGRTRSTTKNLKTKQDEDELIFIEQDILNSDKLEKPTNPKTKGIYNRVTSNKEKLLKVTKIKENISKISDNIELENGLKKEKTSKNKPTRIRKKRKLFSSIVEETNCDLSEKETAEADKNIYESTLKRSPKKLNFNASTCHENEQTREPYKSRNQQSCSKSKVKETLSPRSQKLNQAFDKLIDSEVNNTKELFVDVKSGNNEAYNFTTSESEDEDFKRKKTYLSKRNSRIVNLDPSTSNAITKNRSEIKTRRKRSNINKAVKKSRVTQAVKKRPSKRKISIPTIELVDERIRQSNKDVLNTSFIMHQPKNFICSQPDPVLTEVPKLEYYGTGDKENGEDTKTHTKMRKSALLDEVNKIQRRSLSDDRTNSPLPELVVEMSEPVKKDDNDIRSDIVQSLKQKYMNTTDVYLNDTINTTHQLLHEEKTYQSKQAFFNDDVQIDSNNINIFKNQRLETLHSNHSKKPSKRKQKKKRSKNIIDSRSEKKGILEISEMKSEKSIPTDEIPGHGVYDESPPTIKYINQTIAPRNLETEYLDKSMQNFYNILVHGRNEYEPTSSLNKSEECINSPGSSSGKDARVSLSRLTFDDMKKVCNFTENVEKPNDFVITTDETLQKREKLIISDEDNSVILSPKTKSNLNVRSLLPLSDLPGNSKMKIDIASSVPNDNKDKEESSSVSVTSDKSSFIIRFNKHKWLPSSRDSVSDFENLIRKSRTDSIKSDMSKTVTHQPHNKCKQVLNSKNSTEVDPLKWVFRTENAIDQHKADGCDRNESSTRGMTINKKKSSISPIEIDLFTKPQNPSDRIVRDDIDTQKSNTMKRHKSQVKRIDRQNVSSPVSSSPLSEDTRPDLKRTSQLQEDSGAKKLLLTPNSISDRTVSSVKVWFDKMETAMPDKDGDAIRLVMVDTLRDIMEKLATTFTEVNANTNKKLVHMFVDVQKELEKKKEERRTMVNEGINKLMDEIKSRGEVMLTDLESRSKSMDTDFIKQLRNSAYDVLLEDSKTKQTAMKILQEDVNAVIKEIQKGG